MVDPIFWLGLSFLLVAVCLAAVLVVALPALQELARAARSAEKLFDTLSRELPPTLEAIRLTGLEISDLTDDMSEGVQSANRVVQQVDQSVTGVKKQAKKATITTRSVWVGAKAAWRTLTRGPARRPDRLPPSSRSPLNFPNGYPDYRSVQRRDDRPDDLELNQSPARTPPVASSGPSLLGDGGPELPNSLTNTAQEDVTLNSGLSLPDRDPASEQP